MRKNIPKGQNHGNQVVAALRLLTVILLAVLVLAGAANAHTGQAVYCIRVETPVRIDGSLDDAAWAGALSSRLRVSGENLILGEADTPEETSAEVLFAWDDDFLYLGLIVSDDEIVTDRIPFELGKQDSVQFLFDFSHEGTSYGVFSFAPDTRNQLGPWFSIPGTQIGVSQRQFGQVTRFRRAGYAAELAIPRNQFEKLAGLELTPGLVMGLNVVVNNAVPNRGWQSASVWSGTASDWSRAYGFGDLIFMEPLSE